MAKKMETSKKLVYISDTAAIILSAAVAYGCLCTTQDMTSLSVVTGAAWVECGAAHAFYFWKAKNENRTKYALRLIEKLAKEHGMENVLRLMEIILKD